MKAKNKKPVDYSKKAMIFLRSHLRRMWLYYSEDRKKALLEAKVSNVKRGAKYLCSMCQRGFPLKAVQVDHVNKLGTLNYGNLENWIINLMFGEQVVLCRDCHNLKTKKDRKKK